MHGDVASLHHNARVTLFDLPGPGACTAEPASQTVDHDDEFGNCSGDDMMGEDLPCQSRGPAGCDPDAANVVPAHEALAEPITPAGVSQSESWPEVEIRISTRRKKTSEAKWVGGRIVVSIPAHLRGEARDKTVAWLVERLVSKHRKRMVQGDDDLLARCILLSEQYLIGARPTSVRWVTNQNSRWGSCSFHSGEIRISHRLRVVPAWVLDSVLVHELAHLTYPNHSAAFHQLANCFPRHAEAGTYLAGYGLGLAAPES